MNNKEWLERLAHDAPDELAAWFDAEHVDESATFNETGDFVTHDSRDQLEADVSKYLDYPHDCRAVYDYNAVIGWLDRQAAITKSECANFWQEIAEDIDKARIERDELQAKVDEQQETLDNDCRDLIEYDRELDAAKKERDDLGVQLDQMRAASANLRDLLERVEDEREEYRGLFGKALDLAGEITALGASFG